MIFDKIHFDKNSSSISPKERPASGSATDHVINLSLKNYFVIISPRDSPEAISLYTYHCLY